MNPTNPSSFLPAIRAEVERLEAALRALRGVLEVYAENHGAAPSTVKKPDAGVRTFAKGTGDVVVCPDCKQLVKRRGLGVHRAKRHGKNAKPAQPVPSGVPKPKDRPMLAEPVICPNCDQLTIVNPCARCHMKLPSAVAR